MLIAKIKAHGIRRDVLRWISDSPEWKLLRLGRGILWGSPRISTWTALTFIIFINDLDTKLTSIMNKFADDTKLGHKVNTDRDRE